jgi:hypothetical protein
LALAVSGAFQRSRTGGAWRVGRHYKPPPIISDRHDAIDVDENVAKPADKTPDLRPPRAVTEEVDNCTLQSCPQPVVILAVDGKVGKPSWRLVVAQEG